MKKLSVDVELKHTMRRRRSELTIENRKRNRYKIPLILVFILILLLFKGAAAESSLSMRRCCCCWSLFCEGCFSSLIYTNENNKSTYDTIMIIYICRRDRCCCRRPQYRALTRRRSDDILERSQITYGYLCIGQEASDKGLGHVQGERRGCD